MTAQHERQVIGWDRGRLARKRTAGARLPGMHILDKDFFALRAHCGRDARAPSKSLNPVHRHV